MITLHKTRQAFSMITAIFVILLIATLGAFIMNLSGKMVQATTSQYKKEQAILYAKSYTEFAIMAASSERCVNTITANLDGNATAVRRGDGYYVEIRVQYLGAGSPCGNNVGLGNIADARAIDKVILIDTYVRYRDPASIGARTDTSWADDPGITYYRRTLQRL